MKSVQSVFEEQEVGIQAAIHDCHNTVDIAGETEIVIISGSSVIFSCDKLAYEFKNTAFDVWDSVLSKFDMANIVLNAKVDFIIGGEMKAGTANAKLQVDLIIPATSEILVKPKTFVIPDVGTYYNDFVTFHPYNGAAALADGFQVRLTAVDGNITIKNTTALSRI